MATSGFRIENTPQSTPENRRTFASPDEAAQTLKNNLQSLAARRNARQLQRAVVRALAVGVSICAALMLLHRFYLADVSPWALATILGASALIGVRNGFLNRAGAFDAAVDADLALGLGDRLSSAMAFVQPDAVRSAQPEKVSGNALMKLRAALFPHVSYRTAIATSPTEMVPALVFDAAARSTQAQAKQIYPTSFDRPAKVLAAASVAFAGFAFMPNIELTRSPEQRALAGTLNREGKKLEAIAKQVQEKKADEANPETKKLAAKLKALGLKMQRGRMSKREALVSMGQLKKDMEQSAAQNEQSGGGLENIEQLQQSLADQSMQSDEGRGLREAAKKKDLNKAAAELDKLAEKMEKGQLSEAEKQKAAADMEKAARALRQAGGAKNEDAARQLEEAAKQLRQKDKQDGQKQSGQKQDGQQQNGQQNKSGQQGGQKAQQNGQKQGQQNQQGQQQQSQNGQQQQGGQQQGQKGQSQQNQGQSGQQQQGQQQGQQGGQKGQSGQGSQGNQSGANALRNMANGMRQGGASGNNSQDLKKMLDKIRESENDTGQNNGQNSGQGSGQGQDGKSGDGQGEGGKGQEGQGMTPGKDIMPTDPKGQVGGGAGLGPRNNAGGVNKGGGVSNTKAKGTGDKRRWEDVWSDRLPQTQNKASRITGKMGNSGKMEQLPTRTEAKGGPVKTPYYEVYESYKKDMEDAVEKVNVPPAYKQPVRDYFDSLKPEGK